MIDGGSIDYPEGHGMKQFLEFDHCASLQWLQQTLDRHVHDGKVKAFMILLCEGNHWNEDQLNPILRTCKCPVFGGVFPGLMHEGRLHERGSCVIAFESAIEVIYLPMLSNPEVDLDAIMEAQSLQPADKNSAFVFYDATTSRAGDLVNSIFSLYGLELSFIGGGAGSRSLQGSPCILTRDGLVSDAAVIALSKAGGCVKVARGWEPVSTAMRVTESRNNRIFSIDWRPAASVYREIVSAHRGEHDRKDASFYTWARHYPFGHKKLDQDWVVRDPYLELPDESLLCFGEIPTGALISVLHGEKHSIITAAQALPHALAVSWHRGNEPHAWTLAVDCVSRASLLGDDFSEELRACTSGNCPSIGVLTFGEIANSGKHSLDLHNKTLVIAWFDHTP
jgi:hypothetical protein